MHTTNYKDTFIEVADDCPVSAGEIPPLKKKEKTIARLQYEMLKWNPYHYTSDDVIFIIYAKKNKIPEKNYPKKRNEFFLKGQACMRSSPLTKRYGWGVHFDSRGKMALYGCDSEEYRRFCKDKLLAHKKAMKSKK